MGRYDTLPVVIVSDFNGQQVECLVEVFKRFKRAIDILSEFVVIMNFENDGVEEYESLVAALERREYRSKPKKLELDMKHHESPHAIPSIEEAPKLEHKALHCQLRYVLLGRDDKISYTQITPP